MRRFAGVAIAALIAGAAFGQTESTLKFEAADIHTSAAAAPGNNGNQFMRGGFYRVTNALKCARQLW